MDSNKFLVSVDNNALLYWWAERYHGLVTDCLTYFELDPSVYDAYAAFWIIYYWVKKQRVVLCLLRMDSVITPPNFWFLWSLVHFRARRSYHLFLYLPRRGRWMLQSSLWMLRMPSSIWTWIWRSQAEEKRAHQSADRCSTWLHRKPTTTRSTGWRQKRSSRQRRIWKARGTTAKGPAIELVFDGECVFVMAAWELCFCWLFFMFGSFVTTLDMCCSWRLDLFYSWQRWICDIHGYFGYVLFIAGFNFCSWPLSISADHGHFRYVL